MTAGVPTAADCAVCDGYGWVCDDHGQQLCACGGAETPCLCNPEALLPEGFVETILPADLAGILTAGALGFEQKV